PIASAIDPIDAPIHGAVRPSRSWDTAGEPVSTTTPSPVTSGLRLWKPTAPSAGPSEKNRPPIDQEDSTPRPACRNWRRTIGGTPGRGGGSRSGLRAGGGAGRQKG